MADNSNKQNAKIGKKIPVISNLTVAPIQLVSQDIGKWKNAVNSARSTNNPRRRLLNELNDNILMDAHLVAVKTKRTIGVTNKRIVFYKKGSEGETVERIQNEVIDTIWFSDLLKHIVDQKFWGHSLIEFVPGAKHPIESINLIPRNNVSPEKGMILQSYADSEGPLYRGDNAEEFYKKYLLEIGGPLDYGLLMIVAQYVIYKRGGFGDWAQFAELFGMPFRVGKYDRYDDVTRQKLIQGLEFMGGAGYTVIPDGTSIEFVQGNSNAAQSSIFSDMIKLCDEQISKAILGGTMTTDNGSSRSQSEVHKAGEEEINKSDLIEIENILNGPFKEKLAKYFGYSEALTGDFRFETKEVISLVDRIKIDEIAAEQVEINPEYWYKTYGYPMPEGGPKAKQKTQEPANYPANDPEKKKTKLSLRLKLNSLYGNACKTCATKHIQLGPPNNDKAVDKLAKAIYDGKLKTGQVDKNLLKKTAKLLMDGVTKGYLNKQTDGVYSNVDQQMIDNITNNVYIFSGFKTYQQVKEATQLLIDENGTVRSFADFKAKIQELDYTYNTFYLASEYNHAIASSQMASNWINIEKNKKDFPLLKYATAGDSHVRDSHAVLDGTVLPVDDVFWNTYYPPNGWGCRCDAYSVDQENSFEPKGLPEIPKLFQNNVGKNGDVFDKEHPYYDVPKKDKQIITETAKNLMPKK